MSDCCKDDELTMATAEMAMRNDLVAGAVAMGFDWQWAYDILKLFGSTVLSQCLDAIKQGMDKELLDNLLKKLAPLVEDAIIAILTGKDTFGNGLYGVIISADEVAKLDPEKQGLLSKIISAAVSKLVPIVIEKLAPMIVSKIVPLILDGLLKRI